MMNTDEHIALAGTSWKRIVLRVLLMIAGFMMFAIGATIQGSSSAGDTHHTDVRSTSSVYK